MKEVLHASSISLNNQGILITGQPGTGKSTLALQLIDRGAILISDDQTIIMCEGDQLTLSPPPAIQGLIEVRGIGICEFPFQEDVPFKLCVELCADTPLERLPDPLFVEYHGVKVPLLKLIKNDPIGMIKIELKVKQ